MGNFLTTEFADFHRFLWGWGSGGQCVRVDGPLQRAPARYPPEPQTLKESVKICEICDGIDQKVETWNPA